MLRKPAGKGVNTILDKYGIYMAAYYSMKRKLEEMGEVCFRLGMTPQHLKRIRELEKENSALKQLLAEKELEGRQKNELLKKVCLGEKREIVNTIIFQGMRRDLTLSIAGISKHKYYYTPKPGKRSRLSSEGTLKNIGDEVERVPNAVVVEQIKETQTDPYTVYGHHKMTYDGLENASFKEMYGGVTLPQPLVL